MIFTFEDAKEKLIGERVSVQNEVLIIFSQITEVISAIEALDNPEIRSGAKDDLQYVVGGIVEKNNIDEETKFIKMYVYLSTDIKILLNCTDFSF